MTLQLTLFSEDALAILNAMPLDPNATYFYEHLSGGFVWSDEFPSITSAKWKIVEHDCLYRYLIQMRRLITLGDASIEMLPLWRQVVVEASNWPGLQLERRSGRIVKRLKAAERLAQRCYANLDTDFANGE